MSARSSTSVWNWPTSLANSSSSSGRMLLLQVGERDVEDRPSCPGSLGAGACRGRSTSTSSLSPTFLPDERRVELGERLTRAELELHALAAAVLHLFARRPRS